MFVYIILFILLIFMIVFAKKIFVAWMNPILFINGVYLVWSFLGRIQYLGQYLPSYDSSLFIFFCVFVIDLAIIAGYSMPQIVIRKSKPRRAPLISVKMSRRIILFTRCICLVVSIAIFINLMRLTMSGSISMTNVRNLSYSQSYGSDAYTQIYFNTAIYYFYQYFIRGFAQFDLTFGLVLLLKEHSKISLLTVINFALWSFIMLSRIEILKAVILCVLIIFLSKIELTRKQRKWIIRAIAALAVAVIVIFSFRSSNSGKSVIQNSIDELIVDFSGSNYMFSTFFEEHFSGVTIPDVPYLLKIFGGFGLILEYFVAFVFDYYFDHSVANQYLTLGHNIGSSTHYNAFYTMFFDSLNTGGVIGCLVFCILLGALVGIFFKKYVRTQTSKNLYLVAYFTYIVVMGTYNYALTVPGAVAIIFCALYRKNEECRLY